MDIGITTRKSIFSHLNYFKVTCSETEVSEQVYCIIPATDGGKTVDNGVSYAKLQAKNRTGTSDF